MTTSRVNLRPSHKPAGRGGGSILSKALNSGGRRVGGLLSLAEGVSSHSNPKSRGAEVGTVTAAVVKSARLSNCSGSLRVTL
ncbi:hypothetical protein E2C01_023686 [Portunus trituberculatus]|uniref:Uncharacterized protein n=1 Tax=Portunus trituberculatus TaxID=210409 RepID=A0A5B7E8W4_PORTR|nr:hypothetical protein [Portunus trituberculatus]